MMLKPTGYYVRVSVEVVEQVSAGGIIKATNIEHTREQDGHDVGVLEALGPTAYSGFQGVDDKAGVTERAAQYGLKIGDKVQFNRYDGKVPRHQEEGNYRIIQDQHIIGVYDE